MKAGIIVFPGSNCEQDCHDAITRYLGEEATFLWHGDTDLSGIDCVILPGGFSYGDYLRCGAIAQFSPIMKSVIQFADSGGIVLGICNGFQVLTECGLLPGSLVKNTSLKFICDTAPLEVVNTNTRFTSMYATGETIQLPVAHGEGNYFADPETVQELEKNHQVVFRYANDINGSVNRIAGICNKAGNVLGMMPHPERNLWKTDIWTGEGARLFDALKVSLSQAKSAVHC